MMARKDGRDGARRFRRVCTRSTLLRDSLYTGLRQGYGRQALLRDTCFSFALTKDWLGVGRQTTWEIASPLRSYELRGAGAHLREPQRRRLLRRSPNSPSSSILLSE